jgi:hypothetical protein
MGVPPAVIDVLGFPFYSRCAGKLHERRSRFGGLSVQFAKIISESVKKYLLFGEVGV